MRSSESLNVFSLIVLLCALTGCTPSQTMPQAHSMPVKLLTISQQPVNDTSDFMCTLKSREAVTLQPQVAGRVTKIFATSGQLVTAQQPLLQVDPQKQISSVNSYSAAVESSQADRESAAHTLASLQATRLSKLANVSFAKKEIARYTWLEKQGAVAKESVDTYQNTLRVSEAELQQVEEQIRAQKSALSKMDKTVQQTQASAQEQRVQLQYYVTRAPFAGVVGDVAVRVGDYVDTTTKLTSVTQNHPLEGFIDVPSEQAGRLKPGMPVVLHDSAGAFLGEGKIFFISPNVNEENQAVLIKAIFDNTDGRLRSSQVVTAKLVWDQAPGMLIPTVAVSHISGEDFVFVADGTGSNTKAKQKNVRLGPIYENSYLVKSGLAPGERIVVSGIQNLIDGMPIAPVE